MDNDDFFVPPPDEPVPPTPDSGPELWSEQVRPTEDQPIRRTAVVLAILLPFLASTLGLVWALRQGPNPRLAEASTPGVSTIERLEEGAYSVWARNADGSAVRWNGCETIRWVFNPNGAPLGAVDQLLIAMGRIEEQTGLRFEYLGETDELPRRNRPPYQPDRYDLDRWAPMLVSWRTPETTDAPLTTHDRAVAIPVAVGTSEQRAFVTAQVIFNRDSAGSPGFSDRRRSIGITMLHELLHVVGLQHVDDPGEIMFPFPVVGDAGFGPGDIAGMREVGTEQPCVDTPTPEVLEVDYAD